MKKKSKIALILVVTAISYVMISSKNQTKDDYGSITKIESIEIPSDIAAVIDDKCSKCHRSDSKSSKSKAKLNFDKFSNGAYSDGKLVSKFGKITKELNGNKMPPKKYISKNPDQKLTKEETELLLNWADEQTKQLSKE